MRSSDRVLVCTAHPDDEMLIAGTLRRLCLAGVEVTLLCATRGELGAIRDAAVADRATIDEVRAGELAASAAVIGIARVLQFHYPDSEVEHWRGLLLGDIAAAISEIDPHLVITFGPDGVTRHGDHISVSRATTDAVLASTAATGTARHLVYLGLPRPVATRLVVDFLMPAHQAAAEGVTAETGYENADEATRQEWLTRLGCPPDELDLRVDVSDQLEAKAAVFRCHASQPGSEQAGGPLFRSLFAEEFFRTVIPPGVVPPQLETFVTQVVST
ncbi:MAG TPA: PIG-L family deacetylase [Acidimicrobiales bacterium]|nr:PIG-L family deacetylase [Acidimicrobiales bacterium]